MFVLTIDQQRSRSSADAVPKLLDALNTRYAEKLVLPFERTAGDEVQCLLDDAETVVDLVVDLLRVPQWYIGIGVGDVEAPLPDSVRAARGTAFLCARTAVDRAKNAPANIAVEGTGEGAAHAEAALWLFGSLLIGRTPAGWEAVDARSAAKTQVEAATRLGISPQAINSRLQVAGWRQEQRGRELVAYLLEGAS
ncbi:MAG: SatD family protein [Aeromicrobium sp.]